MKTRLTQCLQYLEEVEAKIIALGQHPTPETSGHDLLAISQALDFVRHASAAVTQAQREIAGVPDAVIHMNGRKPS